MAGFIPRNLDEEFLRDQVQNQNIGYGQLGEAAAFLAGTVGLGYMGARNKGSPGSFRKTQDTPDTIPRRKRKTPIEDEPKAKRRLNMDIDMDKPNNEVSSRAGSKGDGMGKGTQETPITFAQPTYGLPETHTCILPATTYFSVGNVDKQACVPFKVHMNSPVAILQTPYTDLDPGDTIDKTLYNKPLSGASVAPTPLNNLFPITPSSVLIPAWRKYFDKLYSVYTVLGCEWKLTVTNLSTQRTCDAIIGVAYESEGASSSTAKLPDNATLHETFSWKDINYTIVQDSHERSNTAVLTGRFKPGQAPRDVTNDEDVKTWTGVTSEPALIENLKIMFWKAPLAPDNFNVQLNCQLQLKYIIQYKDLATEARYPTATSATTITQTLPTEALST